MTIKFLIKYNPAGLILLMVLLVGQLVWQAPVQATTILISAEFTPNRNNPNNKTFTNTSRLTGVCSNTHAAWCKQPKKPRTRPKRWRTTRGTCATRTWTTGSMSRFESGSSNPWLLARLSSTTTANPNPGGQNHGFWR